MDKERLWKLWTLIHNNHETAWPEIVAFEIARGGKITLLNNAGEGPGFESINMAIDYLDPPEPPTSSEWRALFKFDGKTAVWQLGDASELCKRHDRAMTQQRLRKAREDLMAQNP